MNKEDILKLATLARIDISIEEAEKLSSEFGDILGYVDEIKEAKLKTVEIKQKDFVLKNIMRDDNQPHETGVYTEKLIKAAPSREGDFVKVKKIL